MAVERELCMFVQNKMSLGLEETCQHCCLSTASIIVSLQREEGVDPFQL